jgi:hypothetical protein
MKRRIIWKYGDSAPLYGQIIAAVEGDGELDITVGFPVSSVEVAFSKSYNRYLVNTFGYDYEKYAFAPEVTVSSVNSEGFVLSYRNIPESLEVNYFVM